MNKVKFSVPSYDHEFLIETEAFNYFKSTKTVLNTPNKKSL